MRLNLGLVVYDSSLKNRCSFCEFLEGNSEKEEKNYF